MMQKVLSLIFSCLLLSCAPSIPDPGAGTFILKDEISTVELARQGFILAGQGRNIDAELLFRQARYLSPEAPNLKENLALVLAEAGHFDESKRLFEELLQSAPKSLRYMNGLGRLYYVTKRYDLATEQYLKVWNLAADVNDIATLARTARNLAVVRFIVGDEEGAKCYSAQSVTLQPDITETARHARLLIGLGNYNEAIAFTGRYLQSQGGTNVAQSAPGVVLMLGIAQAGVGQFEAARRASESIISSQGIDPAVLADANLLRYISLKYAPASPLTGDREEKELDDEEIDVLLSALSEDEKLVWPDNLVQEIEEILKGRR